MAASLMRSARYGRLRDDDQDRRAPCQGDPVQHPVNLADRTSPCLTSIQVPAGGEHDFTVSGVTTERRRIGRRPTPCPRIARQLPRLGRLSQMKSTASQASPMPSPYTSARSGFGVCGQLSCASGRLEERSPYRPDLFTHQQLRETELRLQKAIQQVCALEDHSVWIM
jgi:hypothetical protein